MSQDKIRILLIEDNPDDVFLITEILSQQTKGGSFSIDSADSLQEGLKKLEAGHPDVVLLDLFLTDTRGSESFERMKPFLNTYPVIVMTSLNDEALAIRSVSEGAQDYLVKGQLNRSILVRTIRYAIERARIRKELDLANTRLEQLALNDPLTGLFNRRGLEQVIAQKTQRASLEEADVLALLLDMDDFKRINDTMGHAAGDEVLKEITRRLKTSVRASDYTARIGGDEFLVLLPATRLAEGVQVAEKARLAIAGSPIVLSSGEPVRVTASLGLATIFEPNPSIDQLLTETHAALHKSKKAGKNKVSYEVLNGKTDFTVEHRPSDIVVELCSKSRFRAVSQPIFSLTDRKEVGREYLSRSSIESFEMPDDFFRAAFEHKVMLKVDELCFKTCLETSALKPFEGRTHINLFPATISHGTFRDHLRTAPTGNSQYCIEISEQQIVGDPSYLVDAIEGVKKAGYLVAIEDVGFGRSTLESLILLEPHIVKLERRCIRGIHQDKALARSLKRILNVAQALNTEVIAEGIETEEDFEVLRDLGVPFGQGFYLARPN